MTRARALAALSLAVFASVFAAHGYFALYPPVDPAFARWAPVAAPAFGERFAGYFASGGFWLGYCYGLSAGFVVYCVGRRLLSPAPLFRVAGGVTLSGAVAASACFLTGCCGSPMLGVWVAIFGAAAAAWLGPAAALLSTVMVFFAWRGLSRTVGCDCKGEC